MKELSIERLKEVVSYDPVTGIFVWLVRPSNRTNVGALAGWFHSHSKYWLLSIDGQKYRAHRLAWYYMTGAWPPDQIDHINGKRDDNRFENLRPVTNAENGCNQRQAKSNNLSSGLLGVSLGKNGKNWGAHIKAQGKMRHLGYFGTKEEAHDAYVEAKRRFHDTCTL